MRKITLIEIPKIYELAKEVFFGKKKMKEALKEAERFGMSIGSANDLIVNFKHLFNGTKYTRTLNSNTLEYYLEHILKDFGQPKLQNAITSLEMHIPYYERTSQSIMHESREILKKYKAMLDIQDILLYPDEILDQTPTLLVEGAKKQVLVNAYERNSKARLECIKKYGYCCAVCKFDFKKYYGAIGENFIHVHHLKQLSEIQEQYEVNPIEDLRPVCPNCHAMLHRKVPPYSIEELKQFISE